MPRKKQVVPNANNGVPVSEPMSTELLNDSEIQEQPHEFDEAKRALDQSKQLLDKSAQLLDRSKQLFESLQTDSIPRQRALRSRNKSASSPIKQPSIESNRNFTELKTLLDESYRLLQQSHGLQLSQLHLNRQSSSSLASTRRTTPTTPVESTDSSSEDSDCSTEEIVQKKRETPSDDDAAALLRKTLHTILQQPTLPCSIDIEKAAKRFHAAHPELNFDTFDRIKLDCLGELRELRKKMNWETMRNRLNIINADDMNDPALSDPVLKAKLRENSEKGRKRLHSKD